MLNIGASPGSCCAGYHEKAVLAFMSAPRIEAFAGIKLLRSDSESVVLEVKGRGANRGAQ